MTKCAIKFELKENAIHLEKHNLQRISIIWVGNTPPQAQRPIRILRSRFRHCPKQRRGQIQRSGVAEAPDGERKKV